MFRLDFDPEGESERLAVLTIDRADEKVNAITPEALDEVETLLDRLEGTSGIVGVVVVSGKPDSFVVGADVEVFARATTRDEIETFARRGHAVLRRLDRFRLPVVAAIHGACLGAGLELVLCCDFRVCSDARKTVLGVPEVQLGLFPGGGGASRLPRLLGLPAALDLILTGRSLGARQALRAGLVDEVVGPEAVMVAARAAARRLAKGGLAERRAPGSALGRIVRDNPVARAIVLRTARKQVMARTLGLYPAPLVAIDVIGRGLGLELEAALALEPPAFAELAVTDASRALVGLFRRSNALKARRIRDRAGTEVAGREVTRLGLLGGGFMGTDIAVVAAEHEIEVRLREVAADPLSRTLARVEEHFVARARKLGPRAVYKARHRISGGLDLAGFSALDLVIEAVPEDLELKRGVFAELERAVGEHTVLASNTSALPIAEIGVGLADRSRLVGLHFFSPVPKMPLLEIVATADTSDATLATALGFARAIGKTPVVVRDGPGFYTTRMLGFYLQAAVAMVAEGWRIEDVDRGARLHGWPVGPLALLDEVGIDVGAKVSHTLARHFPERLAVHPVVEGLLAAKRFGRKSKLGFYRYGDDGDKRPDPAVYDAFPGRSERKADAAARDELGERLTLVAALEAVRCLEDKVLRGPGDGDVAAVFGIGYPPMRGGPFSHLDRIGLPGVLERVGLLADRHGPGLSPPALLSELAAAGRTFSSLEDKVP